MQQPKLILFDLMGTLLLHKESSRPYWHRLGELVERTGIMSFEVFNKRYSGWREQRRPRGTQEIPLAERLLEVVPPLSLRRDILEQLVETYMFEYEERTEPCEGVDRMLEAWARISPIGVVSNFFVAGFPQRLLNRHNLSRYINFIIDSAQIGYRKPAREIYIAALRQAGIDESRTSQVIFVGDDPIADNEGPKKLGIKTFLYSGTRVDENGDHVIQSWNEFRPLSA